MSDTLDGDTLPLLTRAPLPDAGTPLLDATLGAGVLHGAPADRRIADRYRLVELLGSGGHGAVWEARDEVTGEVVAVKLMTDEFSSRPARVRREIAALRLLRLPGVVRLVDEGIDRGRAWLAMERIDGLPFPGRRAPCPWPVVAGTVIALLETLARVHAAGIVHRDLKPGNVLVSATGRPTIVDFGISHIEMHDSDSDPGRAEVLGTPAYLAPEQLKDEPVGGRTDLYAVGVMIYEALSGRLPHEAKDSISLLRARLLAPAEPLASAAPGVNATVAAVVDAMLATRPEDRPRSAAEVLGRLYGAPDVASPALPALIGDPSGPSVDEAALRELFAGPDRLLHLKEDAARALFARTDGAPARVLDEVTAWTRAGLARWDLDKLAIDRDAIDRLEYGVRVAAPSEAPPSGLPSRLDDVLAFVELCGQDATVALVADAMGRPRAEVDADVDTLSGRRALKRRTGGRLLLRVPVNAEIVWPAARREAAHRAIAAAMPPGAPNRLRHLIAGGDEQAPEIAREACDLALRLAQRGQLGRAAVVIAEGLRAARCNADGARSDADALLARWVEIALAEETPAAIDRVLYELCRVVPQTPAAAHLDQLARAALAAQHSPGEQALAQASAVAPFDDPGLERRRQALRVHASRRCSVEQQEALLGDLAAWAAASGDPQAPAALAGWTARLRYRMGRFEEAAALRIQAAEGAAWITERIEDTLAAASALMEAFRHEEAAAHARSARDLAREHRHAYFEAKAEWILRTIAYRTGEAAAPDFDLVDAVARLGEEDLEALVSMTEAAVAYREGLHAEAAALAGRAHLYWGRMRKDWAATFARSLAIGAGAPAAPGEIAALAAQAIACPLPGLGVQALALIARAGHPIALAPGDLGRTLAGIPEERWAHRMDVLSVDEALASLRPT